MARSTPAQKPRGWASRISMGAILRLPLFTRRRWRGFGPQPRPPRVGGVENRLQFRVDAAQTIHHALRPVKVLALPAALPGRRRAAGDVADVADLVSELDELRLRTDVPRMLDLQRLALRLRQALVVGDLGDDAGDLLAEHATQLARCRPGVLDGIVKQGSAEHVDVVDATFASKDVRERD